MKAYIVEVRKTAKGPQIVVSRTHPGLVQRLFELEVPELVDGVVEIKAVAREPGHRTKLAVASNDQNVDPVGACVGARGMRVRQVVNELRGEKVDIVPYSADAPEFVMRALAPAKVREVRIHEDTGIAEVIVPDFQLSLAIGKEGQNARLAARLTGWRVDIKSETQLAEEESGGGYAEGEWVEGARRQADVAAGRRWRGDLRPRKPATASLDAGGTDAGVTPDPESPEDGAMHVDASDADEAADEAAADATSTPTSPTTRPTRARRRELEPSDRGRRRRKPTPSEERERRPRRADAERRAPAAHLRRLPPHGGPDRLAADRGGRGRHGTDRAGLRPGRGAWCLLAGVLRDRGRARRARPGAAPTS